MPSGLESKQGLAIFNNIFCGQGVSCEREGIEKCGFLLKGLAFPPSQEVVQPTTGSLEFNIRTVRKIPEIDLDYTTYQAGCMGG